MIDQETVKKIARLARLSVSEKEASDVSNKMSAILEHFKQMDKLDTKGIEPLVTPSPLPSVLREDREIKTLNVEQVLSNAPEKSGHAFKVPPVV